MAYSDGGGANETSRCHLWVAKKTPLWKIFFIRRLRLFRDVAGQLDCGDKQMLWKGLFLYFTFNVVLTMMIWYETIAFCEGCLKEAVKYASTTTSTC